MAKTVDFYHGTATRNVASIRKTGIKPSSGLTSSLDGRRGNRVYLTDTAHRAKFYAEGQVQGSKDKRVTVLKVSVPASVARTFKKDPIGYGGDYMTTKSIPVKYIAGSGRTRRPTAKGRGTGASSG